MNVHLEGSVACIHPGLVVQGANEEGACIHTFQGANEEE